MKSPSAQHWPPSPETPFPTGSQAKGEPGRRPASFPEASGTRVRRSMTPVLPRAEPQGGSRGWRGSCGISVRPGRSARGGPRRWLCPKTAARPAGRAKKDAPGHADSAGSLPAGGPAVSTWQQRPEVGTASPRRRMQRGEGTKMPAVRSRACGCSGQEAEHPWGPFTSIEAQKARTKEGLCDGRTQHSHFTDEKNKAEKEHVAGLPAA